MEAISIGCGIVVVIVRIRPVWPSLICLTAKSIGVQPRGREKVWIGDRTELSVIEVVVELGSSSRRTRGIRDAHRKLPGGAPICGRGSGRHTDARDRITIDIAKAVEAERFRNLVE